MRTPRTPARATALAVLVVLSLLIAACGSTVPASQRGAAGSGLLGDGLGGPAPTGTSGLPGTPGGVGPGGQGLPGGVGPGGQGLPGGVGSISVTGITAKTIYIGAAYQTDQSTANAGTFGAGQLDTGDVRDYYNVVIKEINANGGIAGRSLVPVFAEIKVTSTQSIDQQFQAACETWTVEHKVFAILESGRPATRECARKAGIVQFGEVSGSVPETFRRYPNYVEISGLNLVREGRVTVDGLAREGYFEAGARIGVVTWDDSEHRASVKDGYIPALGRRGLKLATQPVFIHTPQSIGDLSVTSAGVSNAVLKFNSEDIDHVILQDGPSGLCNVGCLTALFTREAEAQVYRPRYGLNTDNGPQGGVDAGLYPPRQLRGSIAVLWSDWEDSADEGIQKNAARLRCFALMKKAGLTLNNVNAQASALAVCGELWFMQAAVANISGPLNVPSFMAGVNVLGYSFNDPTVYATHFSPAQHDGVSAVRNAKFVDSCTCYSFTTIPYRV